MKRFDTPLSVSDLNRKIRSIVESELSEVHVTGEISNFTRHSSGHLYFTLKDARSELPAAMFKGYNQYLRFSIENGMQVTVTGSVSFYEPRGRLQLLAKSIEPAGVGTLYMAFEALKKKLEDEGVFAQELKKPINAFPRKIGIITSPTGAAIKDILQVLERRAPHVEIVFRPALVQGVEAAADLVKALHELDSIPEIDTIIFGRGGGSLEDLWAFNEESVVRAINESQVPVISAVGHETDISLSDLVADLRAPTPSAAAELAAASREEIIYNIQNSVKLTHRTVEHYLRNLWQSLDHIINRLEFLKPGKQILRNREELISIKSRLFNDMAHRIDMQKSQLNSFFSRLSALNPDSVLKRGYSIAYTLPEMSIIRANEDIRDHGLLMVKTGHGSFKAEKINDIEER